MAAVEKPVYVNPWAEHEAFDLRSGEGVYGEILVRRVLRIELPIDKSEREKMAVAALQAATRVQTKHGSGAQWNPVLLREAFQREYESERVPVTVADEFARRRRQYEKRQQERRGWSAQHDPKLLFAFAMRGGLAPGQRDAVLRILLGTPVADAADEKARQRVRRLFEQTPDTELDAMWNDIRIETLEAEVRELRGRDQQTTAVQSALIDAVADLARRIALAEAGDEDDEPFDLADNGIQGGGQLNPDHTLHDVGV